MKKLTKKLMVLGIALGVLGPASAGLANTTIDHHKKLDRNITLPVIRPIKPIQPPMDKIKLTLETTVSHAENADGSIDFKFVVNNPNGAKFLTFNSGQSFNYIVRDHKGGVVYKWDADKYFTQAIRNVTMNKGEEWVFSDNLKNLPKGTYWVEFYLTAKEDQARAFYKFNH